LREYILNLTPAEGRKIGIKHRSTLKKIKDRVKEGNFNMNTKEIRKILNKVTWQIVSYRVYLISSQTLPF